MPWFVHGSYVVDSSAVVWTIWGYFRIGNLQNPKNPAIYVLYHHLLHQEKQRERERYLSGPFNLRMRSISTLQISAFSVTTCSTLRQESPTKSLAKDIYRSPALSW